MREYNEPSLVSRVKDQAKGLHAGEGRLQWGIWLEFLNEPTWNQAMLPVVRLEALPMFKIGRATLERIL